jgi:hypothetical protein
VTWKEFTESLITEGGKLVVVIFMIAFISTITMTMLFTGHVPQEAGRELLVGAFSSLLTILYNKLK